MGLNFSEALKALRNDKNITRDAWPTPCQISIQWPDEDSKMTVPYIYMIGGMFVFPYTLTNEDLFSKDWTII